MVFQLIGRSYGYTLDGARNADLRYGTLVTLQAPLLLYLEEQRAVAERRTALHTFSTTVTEVLVNGIFEVGLLNKTPRDGTCRTHQILGCRIELLHTLTIVATAEVAVTAYLIGVETLHRRYPHHAFRLTAPAL